MDSESSARDIVQWMEDCEPYLDGMLQDELVKLLNTCPNDMWMEEGLNVDRFQEAMNINKKEETASQMDEEELQELLQVGEEAATVDYTLVGDSLNELDKLLEGIDKEQKLTDICSYENISSDEGKLTAFLLEHSPVSPSGVMAESAYDHPAFPYRGTTIQTGYGEPGKGYSPPSSTLEPPEGTTGHAPEEDTVVEPIEVTPGGSQDEDLDNVLQKLEEGDLNSLTDNTNVDREETVVEPVVDNEDKDLDQVLQKLDQVDPTVGGQRELREEIDDFPSTFFEVQLRKTRSFKHRQSDIVNEYSYQVQMREEVVVEGNTLGTILPQLYQMFASILQEINLTHSPSDLVRIFITHQDVVALNIIVGPDYLDKITANTIINHITDVIHSNNFIPANRGLSINVTAIRNISGLNRLNVTNVFADLNRKGCIIAINNTDNLCLPRAIAVAVCRQDFISNPGNSELKKEYDSIRRKDRSKSKYHGTASLQKRTALKLMRRAGIPTNREGLLSDIPLYEAAIRTGITVISARSSNKKVFNGNQAYPRQIILYHSEDGKGRGHFSVLTKVNALLNRSYYCNACDVGFNNSTKHRCRIWCNLCGNGSCVQEGDVIPCDTCHAQCRSTECLDRHKKTVSDKYPSLCERMLFCPACGTALRHPNKGVKRAIEDHVCGENYCSNCNVFYWQDHLCHMRSTPASKRAPDDVDDKRFIFYDFESMLDSEGNHVPNLVVAQSICDRCKDVTHVGPGDKCKFCGSRCHLCCKWNRKEREFERDPCEDCGKRLVTFRGNDTVSRFCSWLISEQHQDVTAVAHNARAYDSYFIYNYIVSNGMKPSIIFRGAKIIHLQIQNNLNIRFLDSLNFLSMPLSQLPKSFGLKEMKKGFFPHLYNTQDILSDPANLVLDSHPAAHYYDADNMSDGRREEFLKWYEDNRNKKFDFFAELEEYCQSDVDILLNACWKFRQLVAQVTGPDHPMDAYDYLTMPSLCMGIFRSKFLREKWAVLFRTDASENCTHDWNCCCTWTAARKLDGDASLEFEQTPGYWAPVPADQVVREKFVSSPICLMPKDGYGRRDNFSREAMGYLYWFEKCYREDNGLSHFRIQHALTGMGEKEVVHGVTGSRQRKYKFDGYFRDPSGTEHVLEFYGCWFHGCPSCYPRDRDKLVVMNKTLTRRYVETMTRAARIREMGYVLHEMWSCHFSRMVAENSDLQEFLSGLDPVGNIDVREAYFGGRTNAIRLRHEFTEEFRGVYVDFCSLYPDVLKYNRYPVGHPERVITGFLSPTSSPCPGSSACPYQPCCGTHFSLPYFGLMKVRIQPPRNLLFPVLPLKINGKLMFPLCGRCAAMERQEPCQCPDEGRSLVNTWCTPEIEAAINMGYEVQEIYEVLHWPETEMIDRESGKGGLFSEYINSFLRLKTQASGYPPGADTPEAKRSYIEDYFRHEGVRLEPTEIKPNPGLRSLAKLALNSFYGKFGQRENMKKCSFLTSAEDIYKYMTDYSKEISDFHLLSDNMLAVEYHVAQEFSVPDPKTSVVIAAFCTCYARLKLWLELNRLGRRVVYHDTDSIIYMHDPTGYNPPLGSFLGELTDELTCKGVGCKGCHQGHWIKEFISCGAKNYAYKLNTGQVVCKVRGFSLNYAASKVVNLDSMRACLESWLKADSAPELVTVSTMILRKKMEGVVYSQVMPKTYGMVYNKRILLDDYFTLPYGYRE